MNLMEYEELKRKVQELLDKEHVRSNISLCTILALPNPKNNGTWRMCINNRTINQITMEYCFPIPRLDNMLDQLFEAKFSKIDMKSGCHKLRIRPRMSGRPSSKP